MCACVCVYLPIYLFSMCSLIIQIRYGVINQLIQGKQ